ncbi:MULTISPECIES: hypothetical protein [Bradyrhizobium]|nr:MULTISPECIES: hypothetical protein [Bradyrhizobium]
MSAERAGKPDAVHVTPEDKKVIDEMLFPYWNGKDFTPTSCTHCPKIRG